MISEDLMDNFTHWYCKEGSGLEDKFSSDRPNVAAIRKVQNSMYYLLRRDDDPSGNAIHHYYFELKHQEYDTVDISHVQVKQFVPLNKTIQNQIVYFTIHMPDVGMKLLVSREVVMLESKVFAAMIESTTSEITLQGEKYWCEHFVMAMEFIHSGKLGLAKRSFNDENDTKLIGWHDLLELLKIADQYQLETLIRAISRVVNQFNAVTIGLKCLEFSADCKEAILPVVCSTLGYNSSCVVSDAVFNGEQLEYSNEEDLGKYKQDPSLLIEIYPFLEHAIIPKKLVELLIVPLAIPVLKIVSSLPYEITELLLDAPHFPKDETSRMIYIIWWMIHNVETRLKDAYRLLRKFDWSLCQNEILYFLHTIISGINKSMPKLESITEELEDILHMYMFKSAAAIDGDHWNKYLSLKIPEFLCYEGLESDLKSCIIQKPPDLLSKLEVNRTKYTHFGSMTTW